jgi:YVTN family beta-propeller protein
MYYPTNNKIYCANQYGNSVSVISSAYNYVITTIPVGKEPVAFAWNPVQDRTYVANRYCSSISVIRGDNIGIEEENKNQKVKLIIAKLEIYTNPCRFSVPIKYELTNIGNISIRIYDLSGQCVKTLINADQNEGLYEINWNGTDNSNRVLPQGIYFVRMEAGDYQVTSKIVLLRRE